MMRMAVSVYCLVFCLSLLLPAQVVMGAPEDDGWSEIEPGIDYREYLVSGPNRVFVARMNRSQENVVLDTSIGQGRLSWGAEKVSGMAARYDQALSFWEYPAGFRNQVVVAINGSYVNPGTSVPYSGVIQSSWYAKRYDNFTGASFGWKFDGNAHKGSAYISDCVHHDSLKQYILITNKSSGSVGKIDINGINISRPSNQMILYTHQYDRSTWTANDGIEVLVEMERPNGILSEPRGAKGIVVAIKDPGGSTLIPFDHIVLSAHGTAADKLRSIIGKDYKEVDYEVQISQEIKSYIDNCTSYVLDPDWTKTYAGLTGDHTYLRYSEIIPHPNHDTNRAVHPRTAIAFNEDYIYFIVVDGRQPGISVGMTYVQLGDFSKNYLAAHTGMALDGGGSSTMVINGRIMNNPSDRCFTMYLPVMTAPNRVNSSGMLLMDAMVLESVQGSSHPSTVCERFVGSGLMMIVLQPNQPSSVFQPGYTVLTQFDAQVRLGPGTNYGLLATITPGQEGLVLNHASGLNGVYAKSKHWWKVDFGAVSGWVSEDSLVRKPNSGTPN
jgi:hypothetical protein